MQIKRLKVATWTLGLMAAAAAPALALALVLAGAAPTQATYSIRSGADATVHVDAEARFSSTLYEGGFASRSKSSGFAAGATPTAPVAVSEAPPAVIPAVAEWAMMLFGLLLAGGTALHLKWRKVADSAVGSPLGRP